MGRQILRLTARSIRTFLGRYTALLLIVTLSVGFFAGLKVTKDAMMNTGENYLLEQHFYDYRLFSTLGFSEEDEESCRELSFIEAAEGGKSVDALIETENGEAPFHMLSLPRDVNLPLLVAGRLPESADECLADARIYDEEDIGEVLSLSAGEDAESGLSSSAFTVVGIARSPLYLGSDRGVTDIGSGALRGFLYLPMESFTEESYTEMNLLLSGREEKYHDSDAYDEMIEEYRDELLSHGEALAKKRYEQLLMLAEQGLMMGIQMEVSSPEVYLLTRNENTGYVSFADDSSIVSGIADILPVFFILIAVLVCMTTVSRMVDEERTQIGVLKALGLGSGAVTAKYMLYAGSAALLGWAAGFFFGTWGLPQIFWYAFSPIYGFTSLRYLFSPLLAFLTLGAALAGILGSCFFSCRKEMRSVPAELIRPRAAKAGKRVLLEHFTLLWKRLSFLRKITLRNMFRYKQRFVMMLVGIGCCAAMVVTSFGLRDSMLEIAALHYEGVQTYDLEVTVAGGRIDELLAELENAEEIAGVLPCTAQRIELQKEDDRKTINLYSFAESPALADFWDFHEGKTALAFPGKGEALLSMGSAKQLGIQAGDEITIRSSDQRSFTLTVSGIFDGYIDNFLMLSDSTYEDLFGEREENTLLISTSGDPESLAERLLTVDGVNFDGVTGVKQLSTQRERVDGALRSINLISWVVLLFAGALAFTVIYNLTNINIAERSREIATVQVLGFYKEETESYVLRENLVLSLIAALLGLPLGKLLHYIVMERIVIGLVAFDLRVTPLSYLLSFVCTVLFAVVVNFCMKHRIAKIKMAESLKAVE